MLANHFRRLKMGFDLGEAHGMGLGLGNPASAITGMRAVRADGEILEITEAPPTEAAFEKIAYSSEIYPIE